MKSEGIELHGARGHSITYDKNPMSDTAIAAYELRSPLTLMRLLSMELAKNLPSSGVQRQIAEQLQLLSERSLRLTSDLTKYHQLQTTLFATQPVHVGELWRDIISETAPLYRAHGRKLKVRTKRLTKPLVATNYDLLRRIMLNFVDNALHYSDADGVVELYSTLIEEKGTVRLGVRDHGPALSADLWTRVSSASIQPQKIHGRPSSSSIGLKVACEFAAAINAEVGATRHRDGASFYVDVPISKQLSLL